MGSKPNGLAWDGRRHRFLAADVGDNHVRIVDPVDGSIIGDIPLQGRRARITMKRPKLDDLSFDDLVEEASKHIPTHSETWTDHKFSDPGMTLLDLISWISHERMYYMDL